jgi:hypothetical protein
MDNGVSYDALGNMMNKIRNLNIATKKLKALINGGQALGFGCGIKPRQIQ